MASSSAHYSGDPAHSELDRVRFTVGDTKCDPAQLSDAEIKYLIAQHGKLATAAAADQIAAQFTNAAIVSTGSTRREENVISRAYRRLGKQLRSNGGYLIGAIEISAGGISEGEATSDQLDTDLRQAQSKRGEFDNRRTGSTPVVSAP